MFLVFISLLLFFISYAFFEGARLNSTAETTTKETEVDCSSVDVHQSEHGLGAFANRNIKQGETIEKGVMTPLPGVDGNLYPHLFTWDEERKLFASGSGCLPFYNHSDSPNVMKIGDLENNRMVVKALRDIRCGEELRSRYFSKAWRKCFQSF